MEQHSKLFISYLQFSKQFSGLLHRLSMLFLRKDLKIFTARTTMDNGRNVRGNIFAPITFQKINIDLMKEMRNISIIGFNSLMSFYAQRNGRSDWLGQCILLESLLLFLLFLTWQISSEGNILSLSAILFSFQLLLVFFTPVC